MRTRKLLADEYRKIGNQFIWMFDINVARENQPLEAPRIMDALDSDSSDATKFPIRIKYFRF